MPSPGQLEALYTRARRAIHAAQQTAAISTTLANDKAHQQLTPTSPPRAQQPAPAPTAPEPR